MKTFSRSQPVGDKARLISIWMLGVVFASSIAASVFPTDPSVLDLKRDFGAKGDGMAGGRVKAGWFGLRSGETTVIGEFENQGERRFTPPESGEGRDWVLVPTAVSKP